MVLPNFRINPEFNERGCSCHSRLMLRALLQDLSVGQTGQGGQAAMGCNWFEWTVLTGLGGQASAAAVGLHKSTRNFPSWSLFLNACLTLTGHLEIKVYFRNAGLWRCVTILASHGAEEDY